LLIIVEKMAIQLEISDAKKKAMDEITLTK
jgi:hypothetical protein